MIEKFILSLFTKKENKKVLTIVKDNRSIKVEETKLKEKKPLNKATSLSIYFQDIKSLYQSRNNQVILDRKKVNL